MYYETRNNKPFGIALIIFFLIIILFFLIQLSQKVDKNIPEVSQEVKATGTDTVMAEFNLQDLIKNSSYSIVGVSKLNEKNTSVFVQNAEEKLGIGSGIIISANGLILSNYETTGGKDETCFVTTKNGTIYPAVVKWADSNLDISIIKIAAENLLYLPMGDSNQIEIGNRLYLLSNPTGYENGESVNELLINKKNVTLKLVEENKISYIEDIIKTNLKVDYSNKGGAVLNESGEVLGIASQKNDAIIPINRIKNIITKLNEEEDYQEPYLGIHGFDNEVLKYLIPEYELKLGIYVEKVEENSPAVKQILPGDIITKIDDYELSSFQELSEYLYTKAPKDWITLTIIRGTREFSINVKLL